VNPDRLDRRSIGALAVAHGCVDLCQGAVPALLPFLVLDRGYSYAAAGSLVLAASAGGSIVQPLFGLRGDRVASPWLVPAGLVLGGAGIGLVGVVGAYALALVAIACAGVGVAAFHPEAARWASIASGSRRATGMSLFSIGGNAGFALGPLLVTPLVLVLGLGWTPLLALVPLAGAAVSLPALRRLGGRTTHALPAGTATGGVERETRWAFARVAALIGVQTGLAFGLLAFVPLYLITTAGASKATGNAAAAVLLVAGAVGTLAGGHLADRIGRIPVLVVPQLVLLPAVLALPNRGYVVAFLLLSRAQTPGDFWLSVLLLGFCWAAPFPLTSAFTGDLWGKGAIATTFGPQLPLATLFRAPTVEGLAAVLREAVGAPAWSALVPLRPGGTRPPLFCVHQHTGHLFCYQGLARHLGPDQPIFGLAPRGLDGGEAPWTRIEEMAAHYVREIRALQPGGPYHLAGYCFGGTVAFEIAHQLLAQGQTVGLLALIEASWREPTSPPRRTWQRLGRRIGYETAQLRRLPAGQKVRYLVGKGAAVTREQAARLVSKLDGRHRGGPHQDTYLDRAIRRVEEAHEEAVRQYRPKAYPGRVTHLRHARPSARRYGDPTWGWGGLAGGGIEIWEIPGERPTVVDEPDVQFLAERLRACLEAAQNAENRV